MTTNTMVAIPGGSYTVSGTSTNTITFTSLPSNYTDLILISNYQHSTDGAAYIQFGYGSTPTWDTGSNYSRTSLYGDGSSAYSERASNQNYIRICQTGANSLINSVTQIQNFSNSTTYKTILNRWNRPDSYVFADAGLWRSSNAITGITISHSAAGYFTAGSTFTLYGIANADIGAYATGGIITQDSTYYYHAFGSSGTFTPSRALTADILVVAGGGGGGSYRAGGGGAGGLWIGASQSLTSGTSYTCTVGAGGTGAVDSGAGSSHGDIGSNGGNSSFGSISGTIYGGGYGGAPSYSPASGGSGGGAVSISGGSSGASGTSSQGNAGGNGGAWATSPFTYSAGGGGGAGGAGQAGQLASGGTGGIGYTSALINAMGAATSYGQNVNGTYYFAGGGAGGAYSGSTSIALTAGGYGGGGSVSAGAINAIVNGTAGSPYTGGGGGGTLSTDATHGNGGSGGSGLIIVRYAK